MQKIQHVLSGFVIALVFISASSPSPFESAVILLMMLSGAIFPDIDTPFMHRSLAHNVFIPLAIALLLPFYPFLVFFVFGILLHYALDILSKGNIRLLFPLDAILKNRLFDLLNLDFIKGVPNDSVIAWILTILLTVIVCGVILLWYGVV